MTIANIILAARNKYNSIGDRFFSDAELIVYIYEACMRFAIEGKVIESTFSTTVTDGTREYALPSQTIAIKRVEYDGKPLDPIDFNLDDEVTGDNANTTSEGTPLYYTVWNETVLLRPIPDNSTSTLKVYSYNEPQELTSSSSLEVPSMWHPDVVNYVVGEMCDKDENPEMARKYNDKFEAGIARSVAWAAKKKRSNKMAFVKTDDGKAWWRLP